MCTWKHSLIYTTCAHEKLRCRETPVDLWSATEPEERATWVVLSAGAGAVQGFTGTAYATKYLHIYCRVQSSVWRFPNYWPPAPLPLHPASVSFPSTKGGGYTLARAVRGLGGSIFRKTPDIGLASYSIFPLRPILYSTLIIKWIFGEISSWYRKFFEETSCKVICGETLHHREKIHYTNV